MISQKRCKEILDENEEQKRYSIEEVDAIREILFKLSKIDVEKFKFLKENECSNLHKGIYGRAG